MEELGDTQAEALGRAGDEGNLAPHAAGGGGAVMDALGGNGLPGGHIDHGKAFFLIVG